MLIAHIADIHLPNEPNKLKYPSIALQEAEEYIKEYKPEIVLISGDTFNTPRPSKEAIDLFLSWVKNIIPYSFIIMIKGNHEEDNSGIDAIKVFETIHDNDLWKKLIVYRTINFTTLTINKKPVQIIAISYPSRQQITVAEDETISTLKKKYSYWYLSNIQSITAKLQSDIPSIALLHLTVTGASFGSEIFMPKGYDVEISPQELKPFTYVALGHIHKYQQVSPNAAYSGSPYQWRFDEEGEEKGMIFVEIENTKLKEIKFMPFKNVIQHKTIKIDLTKSKNPQKDLEQAILKTDLKNKIVKVKYKIQEARKHMIQEEKIVDLLLSQQVESIEGGIIPEIVDRIVSEKTPLISISSSLSLEKQIEIFAQAYPDIISSYSLDKIKQYANEIEKRLEG